MFIPRLHTSRRAITSGMRRDSPVRHNHGQCSEFQYYHIVSEVMASIGYCSMRIFLPLEYVNTDSDQNYSYVSSSKLGLSMLQTVRTYIRAIA